MNRILKISGIVGVCAVLFLVVGTITPGWMIFVDTHTGSGYGNSNNTVSMGVFYFSIWDHRALTLYTYNDIPESLVKSYDVLTYITPTKYQYLVITGTLACLMGTILVFMVGYKDEDRDRRYLLLPTVMYLMTAIMVWTAFGIWLSDILEVLAYSYMAIPYSLVFICLGATLSMFNMIPLIVDYNTKKTKMVYENIQ